ncbi:helix-turn-helix transcriptional regulator [Trinickia terrae]|uniref:Helix-turn-helix transcriptional regulator n=1 Tax=Trinickia terrae TaxID=2571161 RepID=A0A4U1IER7_9BURK|nr:AraC family transcriptional regulator [Trinickia terrae]TKC92162.1 helix-turn-helix transcriptional regulator [Trinickia terrae]
MSTAHSHEPLLSPAVSLRRFGGVEASDVHGFHQIVLGLDGSMEMAVDGVGERIDCRSAWLVPAGARHDYVGIGENRQLVLDLPATSLAVPERLFERARAVPIDAALTVLVRNVASSAAGHTLSGDALDAHRFHWDAAARLCAALVADPNTTLPAAGLDYARIDRWLRARLAEPLRIADLAAHCGFGMRRFHQLFNDAFGETPHRYLQRLRLDTAITLLADPRNTLSDVALQVGFGDQSAFTHAFTRRFGRAPGQWRAGRH